MRRLLLAVLLLLLLAVAAVPPLLGERAAQQYQRSVQDLQAQGLQVVENSYQRGWLTSDAKTVLQPADGSWRLIASSHIEHGPLPWSDLTHGRLRLAAARSTTRFSVVPAGSAPQPLPLLLESRLDWRGNTRVSLRSEQEVSAQDAEHGLVLQGLEGELHVDPARKTDGNLKFSLLAVLEKDRPLLRLRELETTAAGGPGPSGVNLGQSRLTLAEMSFTPPDLQHPLHIEGLDAQIHSGIDGEMVWVSADYQARQLNVGGERIHNAQIKIRSDRLSAPVLARIDRDVRALQSSGDPGMDAFNRVTTVMAHLAKLLENDPKLSLQRLYLETPDGAVEGRLQLTLSGLKPAELFDPQRWLEALDGDGELALPEALLRRLLTAQIRRELKDDPALDDSVAQGQWVEDEAQQRIDRLVRQELFQRQGARLHATMRLSAGLLTINGKSIPLPALSSG